MGDDDSALQPLATAADVLGGLGGGTRDTRLLEKAVVQGWVFPEGMEEALPAHLLDKALGKSGEGDREQISAAKALVAMKGQAIQLAQKPPESAGGLTVNVGVSVQAAREREGMSEEELTRAIDERIALLAAVKAKGV